MCNSRIAIPLSTPTCCPYNTRPPIDTPACQELCPKHHRRHRVARLVQLAHQLFAIVQVIPYYPTPSASTHASRLHYMAMVRIQTRVLTGFRSKIEETFAGQGGGWSAEADLVRTLQVQARSVRLSGRTMPNRLPMPHSLCTHTRPPCDSTRCFTIESPNPVPPLARLRALSTR